MRRLDAYGNRAQVAAGGFAMTTSRALPEAVIVGAWCVNLRG
jgi:hypothetical protein